jgi:predicted NodU family carbamoyl transferase
MLLDELEDYNESIPAEYPILDKVYEWEYESWISKVPISLSADYIAAYRHNSRYNEESTKIICVAPYGEEYMRRNEELEDLVYSLKRENEQLKMNIDAERTQHDSDILHLKQKMEKEKISAIRKLKTEICKLEKRIENTALYTENSAAFGPRCCHFMVDVPWF